MYIYICKFFLGKSIIVCIVHITMKDKLKHVHSRQNTVRDMHDYVKGTHDALNT